MVDRAIISGKIGAATEQKEGSRGLWSRYSSHHHLRRCDRFLLDRTRLVFIDETETSSNLARPRGRCLLGQRLIGKVPHGHWKITTFVAALRCDAITATFVIDEPMNSKIFAVYLE